jgi:hypothetical protein
MKKLLLVSALTLGLSSAANADSTLKNIGDFFSGKNQHYNISENDLLNTQWDKFKETDSESIYVRRTDKDNGFSDGVWLKHIQKDGSSDEYKHYLTDCNGNDDVLRNAKVTVRNTDGTLDRQKKDKIIKGDLKQDVRKLVCSAPVATAASTIPLLKVTQLPENIAKEYGYDIPYYEWTLKGSNNEKQMFIIGGRDSVCKVPKGSALFVLNGEPVILKSQVPEPKKLKKGTVLGKYEYAVSTITITYVKALPAGYEAWASLLNMKIVSGKKIQNLKIIESGGI